MRTKTVGTTAGILGAVLIISGLVMQFWIVPGMKQLPADTDVTRTYQGTMHTLLNAEALAAGDMANLFITDVPVDLTRQVVVDDTEGGDALVIEDANAALADGTPVAATTDVYAVDRRTMAHTEAFTADDRIQAREGLVIGWPIDTEQTEYTGWSDDLQSTVPVTFEGEDTVEGVETYRFATDIPPSPIEDQALLSQFPEALPQAMLVQLAGLNADALPVPMEQFEQLLGTMPDPVPLTYLYSGATTYWVEPETGVVVDLERTETREAALMADALPGPVALTAVFDWSYAQTPESVADAIADAEDARGQISLFGTTLPITLYLLGAVLLGMGFVLSRRGRDGSAIELPETDTSATVRLDDAEEKPPVTS